MTPSAHDPRGLPRAPVSSGLLLTVAAIYILTASGLDIFNPALPEIQRTFGASVQAMSSLLNAYFIGFSVLSVAMGVIGDRYDKRAAILACLALFVAGSVLTLVPDLRALTAGRFLQGIGASAPVVLALVLLLENAPAQRHAGLVGKVSAVVAIATCLAPVVGASATTLAGWRGSFALLLAIAVGVAGMVVRHVPASPGDPRVRLSLASYARLLRPDWLPGATIVSLLRANYLAFLGFSAMYYVNELGVSLVAMGFHLGTLALTFSVASVLSPRIARRFGETACVRAGLVGPVVVAAALLAYVATSRVDPVVITGGMALVSALVVLPNNLLYPKVLSAVPDMRGRAAALVHAFKMIFSAGLVHAIALSYDRGLPWIVAILAAGYVASLLLFELSVRGVFVARAGARDAAGELRPLSVPDDAGSTDVPQR